MRKLFLSSRERKEVPRVSEPRESYVRFAEQTMNILEEPGILLYVDGDAWSGPWRVFDLKQSPVSDINGSMSGSFRGYGGGLFGGMSGAFDGSFRGESSPNYAKMTNPLIYLLSDDAEQTERLLLKENEDLTRVFSMIILNPMFRYFDEGLRLDETTKPLVDKMKSMVGSSLVFSSNRDKAYDRLQLMVRKKRKTEPVFFQGYRSQNGIWETYAIRIGDAEYVLFPEFFIRRVEEALQEHFPYYQICSRQLTKTEG